MGNCQAIDAATLVIQHPCGRVDNLYWPVTASEVMKMNPGHYVALLITTTTLHHSGANDNRPNNDNTNNTIRFTRIKLLRPTDTLVLGRVYRLITTQEVTKVLYAKKHAKMKKHQSELAGKPERVTEKPVSGSGSESGIETVARRSELEKTNKVTKHEIHRSRTTSSTNSATARSKTWQPSLKSISEAGSISSL